MFEEALTAIEVRELVVFARHGVWPEEKRLGQKFILSLTAQADLRQAIAQDDYTQAVCYATLCRIAEEAAQGGPFNLIETLASRIADEVLAQCLPVREVRVTVAKPGAPLPHALETVQVSLTRQRTVPFALGLGGNMASEGARVEDTLRLALERLARTPGIEIDAVSSLYDSAPWGVTDQPPFVNAAALGRTTLSAEQLLGVLKETEEVLGRGVSRRWGRRCVDLDLLFYGAPAHMVVTDHPALTLPHPQLFNRAFVLAPLLELAPDLALDGRSLRAALEVLPAAERKGVVRRSEGALQDEGQERSWNDFARRFACHRGAGKG
ncbi:dihydroneopterin aldolase [Oecophyllibacter saccharovorans]|uniref:dihydroneopterin aldolase n=1 Tax=Oecophyllibacter saccharovorans TaxID=2558360 RepID=UPI001142ABFD|nr:dihydroneopterin aldolase [Oecophyllibacter saccharovorans]QDH15010.1 dihydroneopterin aldolase [Oecophyllibacter saccharovorans]